LHQGQRDLSRSPATKLPHDLAGAWHQVNRFNYSFARESDAMERSPLMGRALLHSKSGVVSRDYVRTEWPKSVETSYPKRISTKPSMASALNSAISVQSCDHASVFGGYLGAAPRQLLSSASLPAI
jgi:hypothetical protein